MLMRLPILAAATAALLACGERGEAQTDEQAVELAQELAPRVERAVGLPFKREPRIAVRSREQVRRYMMWKLADEWPDDELRGMTTAYRLFGLLPDTLEMRRLLLALYTEQVVGFYEPDSTTLYVVDGSDPFMLRMTMAHELVHALQAQYVPLSELLDGERRNDRRMAAQAVLEGQATLASLMVMMPNQDFAAIPDFEGTFRESIREQQAQMPVFNSAPLVIQEGLIFPYLEGANFTRWFLSQYGDTVPFGERLPQSTEHILHPERYRAGDPPVTLVVQPRPDMVYQDGLGEFEIRVLLTELSGREAVGRAGGLGWGGDQYAVLGAGAGHALVWWVVWDAERYADRFARVLGREWPKRDRPNRRFTIERLTVEQHPAVRLVDAPVGWDGWERLPRVEVRP
ncbi:MAG: hypothetical protein PVF27_05850 [Gemmatimonadales bacterium]|jgi:hypothetical protein